MLHVSIICGHADIIAKTRASCGTEMPTLVWLGEPTAVSMQDEDFRLRVALN